MNTNITEVHTSLLKNVKNVAAFVLAVFILPLIFTSCEIEDATPGGGVGGGSSTSISASNLKGRTFKMHSIGDPNEEGYCGEDTKVITFTSSYSCSIDSYGFDWIWDDRYIKRRYSSTKSCNYSVSGSKITLLNYPFYAFGGDLVLTYYGDFLSDGNDIYYEQ